MLCFGKKKKAALIVGLEKIEAADVRPEETDVIKRPDKYELGDSSMLFPLKQSLNIYFTVERSDF